MKLYYNPLSTYSQKALIALYEKQVAFEPVLVSLMTPEGKAEYEKIYPIGKVPLLKPSEDHQIPESTIIIEYLEGHYSTGTRLIPDGVDEARQVRFIDRMADLYLTDSSATLLFEKFGFSKHTEEQLAKATKYLRISFEQLDKKLAGQEWVCGTFSMADCAVIPALFYCQFIAPFSDYANIVSYYERAKQRPSYAKVMAEFVPIWEGLQSKAAG
ncbi:glutathione S-transferase family protein [Undibacterium sp.]|jgi:glutathione S-transferase|uniref:glutathione S-transferase family protein n=1 Tax=Undibacterium sp. TaxID=1914977 RepID=UPI002CFB9C02|nr:glutathione S-transferase family protein [Undibacterium sp.]HTD07135.1 glutathione S-transferase family protein [Undibacterium sp.]